MQSITEVTVFFATLLAIALVAAVVLLGVLAARIASQRHAAPSTVAGSGVVPAATGRQPIARRLAAHPRRTAHQH